MMNRLQDSAFANFEVKQTHRKLKLISIDLYEAKVSPQIEQFPFIRFYRIVFWTCEHHLAVFFNSKHCQINASKLQQAFGMCNFRAYAAFEAK
jgi:hypothetical protein